MLRPCVNILFLLFIVFTNTVIGEDDEVLQNWPSWRGPLGNGSAPKAIPPTEWSEIKNVKWKTEIPGLGHSTPVVWQNQIFLTTSLPFGSELPPVPQTAPGAHDNLDVTQRHKYIVLAVHRSSGEIQWQTTVKEALPHEGGHYTGSLASASPVTDGKHVYAFFGSQGLYCLDFEGKVVWSKSLGKMQSKHAHGEGSSPVLHGKTIVVNWDHEGQSFVTALDTETGKERWRALRDEVTSWASPTIAVHKGQAQVIVSGTKRIRAYNLTDGEILWECGGLSANVVASPVHDNGIVVAASSYEKQAMFAIRLDGAKGNITDSENVLWDRLTRTPYVPSPLLYNGTVYFLRHYQGILSKVDLNTGEEPSGPFRLGPISNLYASPIGADNKIYFTDLRGSTLVLTHEDNPVVISFNRLNDSFAASPIAVNNQLILRGHRYLYCIEEN